MIQKINAIYSTTMNSKYTNSNQQNKGKKQSNTNKSIFEEVLSKAISNMKS